MIRQGTTKKNKTETRADRNFIANKNTVSSRPPDQVGNYILDACEVDTHIIIKRLGESTMSVRDIYRIEVPCPKCGETDLQLIRELVGKDSAVCSFCKADIPINTEDWQTRISEALEDLDRIDIISPKSD